MQLSFNYGNASIQFDLTYRKRRTLSIIVEAPDKVRVIAPLGINQEVILDKVRSKAPWILEKLNNFKEVKYQSLIKKYVDGESWLFMGRDYLMQLVIDQSVTKPAVKLDQGKLIVITPAKEEGIIKQAIAEWYKNKATQKIHERIDYFQPIIGRKPAKITIKEQQKRWGSCSSKGNLNFNWKAIMAPSPVIDYLVVHELCHLVHHNHSKDFWNLVASILPDYQERRTWLKENGITLTL